jgi:hypothetical protein
MPFIHSAWCILEPILQPKINIAKLCIYEAIKSWNRTFNVASGRLQTDNPITQTGRYAHCLFLHFFFKHVPQVMKYVEKFWPLHSRSNCGLYHAEYGIRMSRTYSQIQTSGPYVVHELLRKRKNYALLERRSRNLPENKTFSLVCDEKHEPTLFTVRVVKESGSSVSRVSDWLRTWRPGDRGSISGRGRGFFL